LVSVPENRSGLFAVEFVASSVTAGRQNQQTNPLYIHGPTGTGKSLLVAALVDEVAHRAPHLVTAIVPAQEFSGLFGPSQEGADLGSDSRTPQIEQSDLLIIEDLQHLPKRTAERLVGLFDERSARRSQMIFTATSGPGKLELPARLTSRLASGLVVGLEPLQAASRLAVLENAAQRRQLAVSRDVLAWLARRLTGGGRQLEGVLVRLEALSRMHRGPLDVAAVAEYFREQTTVARPTIDRIIERVGHYFHVEPRDIQSGRRSRRVMLPRQVCMCLARQLTELSLGQIGRYFGGRHHSTVLHACRKLEQSLRQDAVLSGTIRQLRAGLT
jgi:chromosomal replication initiator protein